MLSREHYCDALRALHHNTIAPSEDGEWILAMGDAYGVVRYCPGCGLRFAYAAPPHPSINPVHYHHFGALQAGPPDGDMGRWCAECGTFQIDDA